MSAVAIDSLRIDLTTLLLSARSSGPTKPNANTINSSTHPTSLFRRCADVTGDGTSKAGAGGGGGAEVADGTNIAGATSATRKSPLPDKVDRCVLALSLEC